MGMNKLMGLSVNVRGLRNEFKRCAIFNILKKKKLDFYFIQETHSNNDVEAKWKIQWGHNIIYSHGTNNACGVAILLNNLQELEIKDIKKDVDGRILLIKVRNKCYEEYTLVNIYAPSKYNVTYKYNF